MLGTKNFKGEMMKVAGIIAEYNPFHNGHAVLIEKARAAGATHIVAVMSGNFVQRGEPAIFDYASRVGAALSAGVDLVIQLPAVYALSGAQSFARAGVEILDSLGFVDEIVFGSECADIEKIRLAAKLILSDKLKEYITPELAKGITFAVARENALRQISPESAEIIRQPNNILGVEYVAALEKIASKINPVTFSRVGAGHGESGIFGSVASASYIRELISSGGEWGNLVPEKAFEYYRKSFENGDVLADFAKFETVALYKMRTVSAAEISRAPDVSEGIENRILYAAKQASTLEELYSAVKTKRYTHARIRRIVVNSVIGITSEDRAIPVPYIRILGFNDRGAELLKTAKETVTLPVMAKTADIADMSDAAKRVFEIECTAGDIYSLCKKNTACAGSEKTYIPLKF